MPHCSYLVAVEHFGVIPFQSGHTVRLFPVTVGIVNSASAKRPNTKMAISLKHLRLVTKCTLFANSFHLIRVTSPCLSGLVVHPFPLMVYVAKIFHFAADERFSRHPYFHSWLKTVTSSCSLKIADKLLIVLFRPLCSSFLFISVIFHVT